MFLENYSIDDFDLYSKYAFHLYSGKVITGYVYSIRPEEKELAISENRESEVCTRGKLSVVDLTRIEFYEDNAI